jgi:hypothetical protein
MERLRKATSGAGRAMIFSLHPLRKSEASLRSRSRQKQKARPREAAIGDEGEGRGENSCSYGVTCCLNDGALIGFKEGLATGGAGGLGDCVRRGGAKRIRESVKLPGFLQRGRPKAGAELTGDGEARSLPTAGVARAVDISYFRRLQHSQTNFLLKVETVAILLSDE